MHRERTKSGAITRILVRHVWLRRRSGARAKGVAGGAHGPCQAPEHGRRAGVGNVLLHMFLAADDAPEAAAERRH